jgi:hypothetical protein
MRPDPHRRVEPGGIAGGIRISTIATFRLEAADSCEQRVAVPDLLQHRRGHGPRAPRQSVPEQDGVVGEDQPHGIAARTVVPPPRRAVDDQRAPTAVTRSRSPAEPLPRPISAPPTPSSTTRNRSSPLRHAASMRASVAEAWRAPCSSAPSAITK